MTEIWSCVFFFVKKQNNADFWNFLGVRNLVYSKHNEKGAIYNG